MQYLLAITLLLAPTYAVKFNLFGLPSNILMLWVFAVWIIFLGLIISKKQLLLFWTAVQKSNKNILVFTGLFFLTGIISLFAHGFDRAKLGQFIVLFVQPISIFFIGRFIFEQYPNSRYLILNTLYIILAAAGLYAFVQYLTLIGLTPNWWGNSVEPKRAISFFSHPNFYALFAAPLLAFLVPDLGLKIKDLRHNLLYAAAWLVGAIGLLLSFSRAGWLGLAAAIFIYLIVAADRKIKKLVLGAVIVMVIVIVAVPNLRYRLILPFYGEKSSVSRLSLWTTGWKGVKESPTTGLGLTGFAKNWNRLNTDPNLDSHNFPHNIFLDFWVETGLLGLVSFIGLAGIYIYRGLRKPILNVVSPFMGSNITADKSANYTLAISLFLIALIAQGLVDNPYFKNDLALVFWIILSLA